MTSETPTRRPRRTLAVRALAGTVAALTLAAIGAAGATSAAAATPNPVSPYKAPSTVEVASPYIPMTSCDPAAKPGVTAFYNQMISTYKTGRSLGIVSACSKSGVGSISEHKEGRAFDWGLRITSAQEKAVADQFLAWAIAPGPDGKPGYNARRLGIMYMIWNKRIWGSYRTEGWRPYTGANPHTDHIHISFAWNGAMKRTSWWTGRAAAVDYGPCQSIVGLAAPKYSGFNGTKCAAPAPITSLTASPLLGRGSTGVYVSLMQKYLGLAPDGNFGPGTQSTLMAFQAKKGLPATGTTDATTWKVLRGGSAGSGAVTKPPVTAKPPVAAPTSTPLLKRGSTGAYVVEMQKRLKVAADGKFGPGTQASLVAFQRAKKLPQTGTTTVATWKALRAGTVAAPVKPSGLAQYKRVLLKRGSRGAAVKAVQGAIGVPVSGRDGSFGPQTSTYLVKFQKAKRIKVTGVVDVATWKALGA